ncbi:MAG: rhodanese-like domain-containing protein [Pyrinomonadaceae bacterium]
MEHSREFEALAAEAKSRVKEVSVERTLERLATGAKLIDVREDNEWFNHASDAIYLSRGIIERDIVQAFPEKDCELILYCGGGYRSALAADNLQKMGYTNVYSMTGGWTAWNEAGAPVEMEIPF